ncbi:hypothetical protein JQC91_06695 [Jannaschia sp. Os4]|uniref:hypothetical protein n=1 Tax=Jannaschia sp. Os4 TaxID=2807617 RepID=UPI0019394C2D|nr:hypothetical protein [Jannaschia sp. Os4]MBM2575987.1 hypothetical protein [Jannaschia sp. Os4]
MRRLIATLLVLAAAPAGASVRGACTAGSMWWAEGALAALGPCEAPGEGFFLLACNGPIPVIEIDTDARVAEGAPARARVSVDGRAFALEGTGTRFPRTGLVGIGQAPIPSGLLEALARGSRATFALPGETRDIHLAGSARAIRSACGG